MLDVNKIREDFPILKRKINGKPLIYFDNTATSQKPIQVINAIKEFYEQHNANIHRGLHTCSQEASELYEEAHDKVAKFIGASGREEIIFVRNASEALNLIAFSWGLNNLKPGDEVITTIMEHHSNIVPWYLIAQKNKIKIKFVNITDEGILRYDQFEKMITDKTKVISVVHMSNVLGTINDIEKISKLAHEHDALFIVDGAQSVPHLPVNVKSLDIDFLAFSGHKMLGPTGIGVLYGKEDFLQKMPPFLGGGDMIKSVKCSLDGVCDITWNELPWKFEAGTPNIAGGIGLGVAVDYLEKLGMENVRKHEIDITQYALKRLEEIEDVSFFGPRDINVRGGIIPFLKEGMSPHEIAILLDTFGIAVRSGFHCAQPLHLRLGLNRGTARASFYIYNTKEEVDVFIDVLKKIKV